MIKFGLNQINKPSPRWMERCLNALIIIIMPAMATFILAIPTDIINADTKNLMGALATLTIALLKAIQFLSGEENEPHEA